MYIVDRNEDFYDYLSHIYGVDKGIVFDRRGSNRITDEQLAGLVIIHSFVDKEYIRPKLILIEIGEAHYLVKLFNFKFNKGALPFTHEFKSFDIEVVHKYDPSPNKFGTPISIHEVSDYTWWKWKNGWGSWRKKEDPKLNIPSFDEVIRSTDNDMESRHIINPILRDTSLTKVLDAHTVWVELETYISSLDNDKDVSLDMTDKEKATIHGFDKQSFRHPIK